MADDQERRSFERREAEHIAEHRLFAAERSLEAQEIRLRSLETAYAGMSERLKALDRLESLVNAMKGAQDRLMLGVILAIISVLGTFILGHFGPVPGK